MATTIERVRYAEGDHHMRKSALRLADAAAHGCLTDAAVLPADVDLLLNVGLYRDRNLGEPALAALIQEDVQINPEDPSPGGHGSFSFDVANGACGVLTAMQVADRFLRAGTIDRALIVASDADPGHHLAPSFPFRPAGGALLCVHDASPHGLGEVCWTTSADDGQAWRATLGPEGGHNRLRIEIGTTFCDDAGLAAAKVVGEALAAAGLAPGDLSVVVASPAYPAFVRSLAMHSGIDPDRVIVSRDEDLHTASFLCALDSAHESGLLTRNGNAVFVSAGSGITAAAAVYRT